MKQIIQSCRRNTKKFLVSEVLFMLFRGLPAIGVISFFVFISCKNPTEPDKNSDSILPVLLDYSFEQKLNTGLPVELTERQTITENTNSISYTTLDWIENISSLVATFNATGKVFFDDELQVSGVSANDFSKTQYLTVRSDDNTKKTYEINILCPQTSGLPVIKINTENKVAVTSKDVYIKTNFSIVDMYHGENSFSNSGYKDEIKGHGNTSWEYSKKSYRIKLNKDTRIFGLEAGKNWVLVANWLDPTLIMNAVTFELGQRLKIPFTHNYVYVELFINDQYMGNYLFTEHNQVGRGRVDIDENEGFFVKLDKYYDEELKFKTINYQLPVMIKSPEIESSSIDNPGYNFIKEALNALDNAVYNNNAISPATGYADLIDLESWAKYLLITELVKNNELWHPKSSYMYKDKGDESKICLGPLWDYDWAFGYTGVGRIYFSSPTSQSGKHAFYEKIYTDSVFMAKYKGIWNEYMPEIRSIEDFIDETALYIEKSYALNKLRWDSTASWDDYPADYLSTIENMKEWLKIRTEWLDGYISGDK